MVDPAPRGACRAAPARRWRTGLPPTYLEGESKEAIKLGIGLTATELLAIDRTLARYGPKAAALRVELKHVVDERTELIWPTDAARHGL